MGSVKLRDLRKSYGDVEVIEGVDIEERQRNGRSNLYDRFRVGTEMKSCSLGENRPDRSLSPLPRRTCCPFRRW